MTFLAQWQTTERHFNLMLLGIYLSLVFRIIAAWAGPIIMLVAAKKLMRIPSRWPAYVIGGGAIYNLLLSPLNIMTHPIVQHLHVGISLETYAKIGTYLYPVSWLLSFACAFSMLTVCKRLAEANRNLNTSMPNKSVDATARSSLVKPTSSPPPHHL